jgi:ankyrin repeat protein
VDAIRLLLDHQADLNQRATDLSTPLLGAVTHGKLDAAQLLIDRGADVNLGDSTNTTPLMAAAETSPDIPNPADLIRLLLKHGAKRGLKDSRGRIAFQRAIESKNTAAVALLR